MKWNLRLAAANRGIWKASELQRMLAEAGLVISAGKMSGLWSGRPASIKLDDLDVLCAVVGCGVEELLIAEPGTHSPARPRASRISSPRVLPAQDQAGHAQAPRRPLAPASLMSRTARPCPATSCPDCLSWGASYGSRSYCRACYDFTRRYHPGERDPDTGRFYTCLGLMVLTLSGTQISALTRFDPTTVPRFRAPRHPPGLNAPRRRRASDRR